MPLPNTKTNKKKNNNNTTELVNGICAEIQDQSTAFNFIQTPTHKYGMMAASPREIRESPIFDTSSNIISRIENTTTDEYHPPNNNLDQNIGHDPQSSKRPDPPSSSSFLFPSFMEETEFQYCVEF